MGLHCLRMGGQLSVRTDSPPYGTEGVAPAVPVQRPAGTLSRSCSKTSRQRFWLIQIL